MQTVPAFFQSHTVDARKEQMVWLEKHLDLKHDFFAKVLNADSPLIGHWLMGKDNLDQVQEERLGRLWWMFLHLFSLMNFEYSRAKELLEAESEQRIPSALPVQHVPWAGRSLRCYLEDWGSIAIDDVNWWLTSFRFTDRYAVISGQKSWSSSTARR
jgi:hypothetical protein